MEYTWMPESELAGIDGCVHGLGSDKYGVLNRTCEPNHISLRHNSDNEILELSNENHKQQPPFVNPERPTLRTLC